MKTPEEIKAAIACCFSERHLCEHCPYNAMLLSWRGDDCINALQNDIVTLIRQLEEQIDLMKIQMQGDCGVCKHWNSGKCDECLKNTGRPYWEYEGLPK
jgi:hypothetical protein